MIKCPLATAAILLLSGIFSDAALAEEKYARLASCTADNKTALVLVGIGGQPSTGADLTAILRKMWDQTASSLTADSLSRDEKADALLAKNKKTAEGALQLKEGNKKGYIVVLAAAINQRDCTVESLPEIRKQAESFDWIP